MRAAENKFSDCCDRSWHLYKDAAGSDLHYLNHDEEGVKSDLPPQIQGSD